MRLARFQHEGDNPQLGIVQGDRVYPISAVDKTLPSDDLVALMGALDERGLATLPVPSSDAPSFSLSEVRLLAPVERPHHDILCLGVNYAAHVAEMGRGLTDSGTFEQPPAAIYFSKRASRVLGPDDVIEFREDLDPNLDYEAELAVIIGKGGKHIPADEVEQHIFGYSVFNDLSSRGLQKKHVQWFLGKSVDTYTAMGPVVVTRDELPFPLELGISSTVNGEPRQDSNTRLLIHGIAEVVSELSDAVTLECGDIIATGTPSGVGMGFEPPRFLTHGDSVTCAIEGIGELTNTVR